MTRPPFRDDARLALTIWLGALTVGFVLILITNAIGGPC